MEACITCSAAVPDQVLEELDDKGRGDESFVCTKHGVEARMIVVATAGKFALIRWQDEER